MVNQPDLNKLKSTLLTSGLQQSNQPLYQVINSLLDAIRQLQSIFIGDINDINNIITNIIININNNNNQAIKTSVFDGIDGQDGFPGRDGRDGRDGLIGPPGYDGIDGLDGIPIVGPAGRDGRDGLTIPGMDGNEGNDLYQFLIGNGGSSTPTSPGGSDTQVQFNDSGTFGGDAGLTYNKTTDSLSIAGLLDISGAAAGQIQFPATQNPSSNGNTLDDFERGTWTPTGHNITFSAAFGRYIKIGRLVYAAFNVTFPVTANATFAAVQSLPFVATSSGVEPPGSAFLGYNSFGSFITYNLNSNTSFLVFTDPSGNNINNVTVSTKQFVGVAVYEATT